MGSGIFFGTMALASVISLVRGFVVAGVLDPAAFGVYVVTVMAGTFGSNLLSLGRVEATWKEYPRLWAAGRPALVRERSDAVMRALAVRAVCVAAVLGVVCGAVAGADRAAQTVMGVAVALGVASTSVYASVLRASYDLKRLGAASFYRAVLALVFAAVGAWAGSWTGALIGEVVAAGIGALVSRSLSDSIGKDAGAVPPTGALESAAEDHGGGRWLAAAFLLGAVPFYLDRMFVAGAFSSHEAGTYGFVMLFASGSAAAVGVIAQKLGPQLLRLERAGASALAQTRLAARWAAAFCAVCIFGMALMSWLLIAGPAQFLGGRYALAGELMFVVCVLCCAQVTVMFDWILISRDRERQVFLVAVLFLSAAGCAALATVALHLDLLQFIIAMVGAKLMSLLVQLVLIVSPGSGRRDEVRSS